MAQSGTVTPGSPIYAVEYNDLRADLLDHAHSGSADAGRSLTGDSFLDEGLAPGAFYNNTRHYWVQPSIGTSETGTAAIELVVPTSTGRPYMEFPNNELCRAYGRMVLDTDYVSVGSVQPAFLFAGTAGSANVYLRNMLKTVELGGTPETGTGYDSGWTAVYAGTAAGRWKCAPGTQPAIGAPDTALFLNLEFSRDGTHASDTRSDSLLFAGWWIRCVSDV